VTIARPYATAIFQLAKSNGSLDDWSLELDYLLELCNDPNVKNFLAHPQATSRDIESVFLGLLSNKVDRKVCNFLRLVIKNDRLHALPLIRSIFEKLKATEKGKVDAIIQTAFDLDNQDLENLIKMVSKKISKAVNPVVKVDKGLIGGIKVQIGDKVWDMSVSGKLKYMASSLSK